MSDKKEETKGTTLSEKDYWDYVDKSEDNLKKEVDSDKKDN